MISKKLIACIIIATMLTGVAATGCSDKESTSGSNYSSADASVSDEITTGADSETNSTSSSDTGSAIQFQMKSPPAKTAKPIQPALLTPVRQIWQIWI